MKILIITGIFHPDIGGPATYVPQIAKALVEKKHQVTVVTYSDRLDHQDDIYSFNLVRLPRKIQKIKRLVLTIQKIITLGKDADILFVNGLALEVAIANKFLKKPLVQKIVGDIAWERSNNKGWITDTFDEFQIKRYNFFLEILKKLRSWSSQQASQIIVPSQYLGRIVENWGIPKEKITVIYNALEIPDNLPSVTIPLKTQIKIITVARLVPWKHVDRIIEVISQLENVGLVIVGEGDLRKSLENLVNKLDIQNKVYFAGKKNNVETLALMASCDIFILNSSYEGLPHVVLEALGLGLPIIATAVGGTPEVIKNGENGFLIPPLDNQKLSEAILSLIDVQKNQLIQENKSNQSQFSLVSMIDNSIKILENTINSSQLDL
jgi:glycosyltransferase involved in cell wall biosynthesis